MKIYQVFHQFDVDGGFGDAVPEHDLVVSFATETEAKRFIERNQDPKIYDRPYSSLTCGILYMEEMEIFDKSEDAEEKCISNLWWKDQKSLDPTEEENHLLGEIVSNYKEEEK